MHVAWHDQLRGGLAAVTGTLQVTGSVRVGVHPVTINAVRCAPGTLLTHLDCLCSMAIPYGVRT